MSTPRAVASPPGPCGDWGSGADAAEGGHRCLLLGLGLDPGPLSAADRLLPPALLGGARPRAVGGWTVGSPLTSSGRFPAGPRGAQSPPRCPHAMFHSRVHWGNNPPCSAPPTGIPARADLAMPAWVFRGVAASLSSTDVPSFSSSRAGGGHGNPVPGLLRPCWIRCWCDPVVRVFAALTGVFLVPNRVHCAGPVCLEN